MIELIVALVVLGLILWGLQQFPLDPTIKKIITVVVIIVAVLWVLQALGLWSGANLNFRR